MAEKRRRDAGGEEWARREDAPHRRRGSAAIGIAGWYGPAASAVGVFFSGKQRLDRVNSIWTGLLISLGF
jgi:hypothetical protein